MYSNRRLQFVFAVVISLAITGCGTTQVNGVSTTQLPASALSSQPHLADRFVFAPGDELAVKFFYAPELNEELVVRPDGRISLQLVPEVMAAGQTPAQLAEALKQSYSAELNRPQVAVIVKSISAREVYVDGEVTRPGMVGFTRPISILQAISMAEGASDRAQMEQVLIIRRMVDSAPLVIQANISNVLDGSDTAQDIYLLPNDIVYLPRKQISNVNIWVDQYVRQNLPLPVLIDFR